MNLGEMTLEDAAQAAAGNWQHFGCFAWHRSQDLHDADNRAVIYTHNRDSGLLDQSNAAHHRSRTGHLHRRQRPRCGCRNPFPLGGWLEESISCLTVWSAASGWP